MRLPFCYCCLPPLPLHSQMTLRSTEVNGIPQTNNSLLVNFGNIQPGTCGVARWVMECPLSGTFISFTADYTHSDELGGLATSLIDSVNTHTLVHDVLVDLPGRDNIRDFLATDGSSLTVYESNNIDTPVTDMSSLLPYRPAITKHTP